MTASVDVTSDVPGLFGCVAVSSDQWLQVHWPSSVTITAKELVPIVIAAAFWSRSWSQKRVCFLCDNVAVVALLRSLTSKIPC